MKISIITVAYNSERTIRDTIESVLIQTYLDLEYIVIDGLSKDKTIDIVKEYETKFNGRMYWISEPDNGIYDAMNKGIKLATGEVITIINSDDLYANPNAIANIVSCLIDTCADCVYGIADVVDYNDINKRYKYSEKRIINDKVVYGNNISKHDFRYEMIYRGWHPNHPSFTVRKELFTKYGLFNINYRIAADFDFMFRILVTHNASLAFIDYLIVNMRDGGESTRSLRIFFRSLIDCIEIVKSYGYRINSLSYSFFRIYHKIFQYSFKGFFKVFLSKQLSD